MLLPKKEKHMASEPANSTSERSTYFYIFLYTSSCKRDIGPSAESYIRDIDVTRATSLSSADVRMTVFMSFCIRTNSFIVWAVGPRNSSDNLTVRVIPFILSGVLQSNFSLATSVAIHHILANCSWSTSSSFVVIIHRIFRSSQPIKLENCPRSRIEVRPTALLPLLHPYALDIYF